MDKLIVAIGEWLVFENSGSLGKYYISTKDYRYLLKNGKTATNTNFEDPSISAYYNSLEEIFWAITRYNLLNNIDPPKIVKPKQKFSIELEIEYDPNDNGQTDPREWNYDDLLNSSMRYGYQKVRVINSYEIKE